MSVNICIERHRSAAHSIFHAIASLHNTVRRHCPLLRLMHENRNFPLRLVLLAESKIDQNFFSDFYFSSAVNAQSGGHRKNVIDKSLTTFNRNCLELQFEPLARAHRVTASVDWQRSAGDERSLVARQENDCIGKLVDGSGTTQGVSSLRVLKELGVGRLIHAAALVEIRHSDTFGI